MNPLEVLIQLLISQAQARPGLGQTQPTATFAGRLVHPGANLAQIMQQTPQESPEAEGWGGSIAPLMGIGGMIKTSMGHRIRDEAIHSLVASDSVNALKRLIKAKGSPQELAYMQSLLQDLPTGRMDRYIMPNMRKRALAAADAVKVTE